MGLEWVEINRLSSTGESKRRIRCLSRHITVFRATVTKELDIFSAALHGDPTSDRFSILVNGAQFNPTDHNLIGFGEEFNPAEVSEIGTVEQYLYKWGASGDVESLLLRVGLGGLSRAKLTELTAAQGHTLRLLAAMSDSSRVLVLKEPFSNVPESFRETVAEMLAEFAWNKHAIVIVTHLSYRPKAWIENEVISRVQVERARQATIGFGGASRESDGAGIAKGGSETAQASERGSYPIIPPARKTPSWATYRGKVWAGLGVAAAGSVALVMAATYLDSSFYAATPSPRADASAVNGDKPRDVTVRSEGKNAGAEGVVNVANPAANIEPKPVPTLMDGYPKEVKEAVLLAFNKPDESVKLWYKSAKLSSSGSWTGGGAREQQGEPGGDPALSSGANSGNESELAARREEIRRKFLEAIQGQQ